MRGRVGYAFDRFMIYGTGGFAYGGVNNRVTFFAPNGTIPFFNGRQNDIQTGYAYGGGVEYALPTDSLKLLPLERGDAESRVSALQSWR